MTAPTRIPEARHPAPALPMLSLLSGVAGAMAWLALTWVDVHEVTHGTNGNLLTLTRLGLHALWSGFMVAFLVVVFGLARCRRSPGAALATAAMAANVLTIVPIMVALYLWPFDEAWTGWRGELVRVLRWATLPSGAIYVCGLTWAAWGDRSVRVIAPAALGAVLLASPPPPLEDWLYQRFYQRAWAFDSELPRVADRFLLWCVPVAMAVATLASGLLNSWIAHRLPRVPADAVAPRPPRRALRAFAVSLILMALVSIAAGLTLAAVIGKPASETGRLDLIIPIAVAAGAALVAAALLWLAITDVGAAASRRLVIAAALVIWCVVVTAAQTLWSQRPELPTARFAVFEPPWMPGMVGAVVAAAALVAIAGALDGIARHLGQRPSRAQTVIVVLALVVGAATVPWLLGFGTRVLPMDGLRIATLASAALVNLAAWLALARSAWRSAQLPGSVGR